jgi:membrane-associated protease RseP (regulator of RpoE activity)
LVLGLLLGFAAGGFTGYFMGHGIRGPISRNFQQPVPFNPNFPQGQGPRGFQPQPTPAPRDSQQPTPAPRGGNVPPAQNFANGAVVTDVVQNGPAAKAGLQAGDVITAIDNTSIDANHSLADLIGAHKPGDKVALSLTRGSQTLTLTVELGQAPQNSSTAYLGIRYGSAPTNAPQRRFQQPGGNNFPNG